MKMPVRADNSGADFDEFSEGDWPLPSWQWNMLFGAVALIVGSGLVWWVAGIA